MKKTSNGEWHSKAQHSCMQTKGFINGGADKTTRTGNSCMQQRGFSNGYLSGGVFSFKSFAIQILFGIIGLLGMQYFGSAFMARGAGGVIESLKIGAYFISVILVIVGLFGIYDMLRKILGL